MKAHVVFGLIAALTIGACLEHPETEAEVRQLDAKIKQMQQKLDTLETKKKGAAVDLDQEVFVEEERELLKSRLERLRERRKGMEVD